MRTKLFRCQLNTHTHTHMGIIHLHLSTISWESSKRWKQSGVTVELQIGKNGKCNFSVWVFFILVFEEYIWLWCTVYGVRSMSICSSTEVIISNWATNFFWNERINICVSNKYCFHYQIHSTHTFSNACVHLHNTEVSTDWLAIYNIRAIEKEATTIYKSLSTFIIYVL